MPKLTHEDQLLVTRAALAGVRFERAEPHYQGWRDVGRQYIKSSMYTLGRAAAHALYDMGEMTRAEFDDYIARTNDCRDKVEA